MNSSRGPRLAAALLAGGLLLCGCGSDRERFDAHMNRASEFAHDGKAQAALLELRSALEVEPDNPLASHKIAVVLENAGQRSDAVYFYRQAYRLDPERATDALSAARLSTATDPQGARALVERVLARDPDDASAYAHLASIDLVAADSESALRNAERAIELGPELEETWLALGLVHQARIRELRLRGKPVPDAVYAEAVAALERAVELEGPGGQGSLERARVLATWPARANEAPAAFRLALDDAVEHAFGAQLRHTIRSVLEYGRSHDQESRHYALTRGLEVYPGSFAMWRELARVEEAAAPGAGESVYRRALEANPGDPPLTQAFARYLLRRDRGEDAQRAIDRALADQPDSLLLLAAAFEAQSSRGDTAGSEATLLRMSELDPDAPETVKAHARAATGEGRHHAAAAELRALTERAPDRESLRMLAQVELEVRNLPAAETAATALIDLAGSRARSAMYLLRAEIRYGLGDFRGVLQDLRVAEQSAALRPLDRVHRAGSLWALGDRAAGLAILASETETGQATALAWLLYVRRLADPAAARAAAEEGLSLHPRHPGLVLWLASDEARQGRRDAAIARLDEAIDQGIGSARLRLLRAELNLAAGRTEAALTDVRHVYERGGGSAAVTLATMLRQTGQSASLIETYQQSATAGTLDLPGSVLLAHLYLGNGDAVRALELLEQAIANGASRPEASQTLAYLLAAGGDDLDRALSLARGALGRLPDDVSAAYTLGSVHLRRGEGRRAVALFNEALARDPFSDADQGIIHHQRGMALRSLGREEEAKRAFEIAQRLRTEPMEAPKAAERS